MLSPFDKNYEKSVNLFKKKVISNNEIHHNN